MVSSKKQKPSRSEDKTVLPSEHSQVDAEASIPRVVCTNMSLLNARCSAPRVVQIIRCLELHVLTLLQGRQLG